MVSTTLRMLVGLAVGTVASATLVTTTAAPAVSLDDPCAVGGSRIACENSLPGSPRSEWDLGDAGDSDIQGFSTDISVNVGSSVGFKVDTNASAYTIGIYRLGWYGGDGARRVDTVTPSAALPQAQPPCITDVATELYDCGNWGLSATWNVPAGAVSGVYEALLTRADNGHQSAIAFVVRDDSSHSDLVFQTSDPTWQAYNTYGGSDFYQGAANGRAFKLSYNRPMLTRGDNSGRDFFFANEYALVRFLERNGYDVSYQAGVDTDRLGSLLTNHRTFVSVGHDEYWSKGQRANVEAARDAGVNLMFLSGNEVYWKTRYEPSADAAHTDYRTLVSYKETWSNAKIDPSDEWTGTWRDPRFAAPSKGGGQPENALSGTLYMSNNTDLPVTVTQAQGRTRLWRNTSLTSMTGASTALAPHTVGYESDEDLDNGFRPAGLIQLSTATGPTGQYLRDYGSTVTPGTTTHHLTMYRAASGALVFSAGTIQWSWGLDDQHDSEFGYAAADPRMQQAQVNLLADMGAQPATLMSTLSPATRSSDTTGPVVSIGSPPAGATIANGTQVSVAGTATDTGGVVAGVEASSDGGRTWHPASGTTSWSYTYVQRGSSSASIQVRAVDDSANIGTAATRSLTAACPCSVFGATAPDKPTSTDTGAVELGLRFSPTIDGFVTGVRFYKGTGNTGTHVGSLWSASGQRLATVTFANESGTGWQTAGFASPIPVVAGTTYVVSYTAPNGGYASQSPSFDLAGLDADPLAVAGGFGSTPAGVYGGSGSFPDRSYQRTQYYVDATFSVTDTSPLTATGQTPAAGATNVPVDATIGATYSKTLAAGSQALVVTTSGAATVPGTTTYNPTTRAIAFTPSAALAGFTTYTVTLAGTDTLGAALAGGKSWTFTTGKPPNPPGVCPCSLYAETATPGLLEVNDPNAVTLGVRFTSDVSGSVTAVRFYKGAGNTGPHVGTLWSAGGARLATGTFTNETASGWQTLTFANPVPVLKNTEYVASYRAPAGRYSATVNAFANADLSRQPLRVTSAAGAYSYPDSFPDTASSTSYLVDVVFDSTPPPASMTSTSPAAGATAALRGGPVTATFSSAIATSGYAVTASVQPAGTSVAGTTTLSADGTTLGFTPSALLPADTDIKMTVSGVTSVYGASLPTQTWTFRTRAAEPTSAQTLFSDVTPAVPSSDDSAAIELGLAFTSATDGTVTAIRFYKGAGNAGTHTGSLWTTTGTRLATATFTNESVSGWQQVTLDTPVAVTAGTTYVVSYYAPQGRYSATPQFLTTAFTNGDLTAPAGTNGRYLTAVGGGFPTSTYGAANYFVDVVFARKVVTPPPPPPPVTYPVLSSNLAHGKTATQSSTALTAPASRAVDGNVDGLLPNGSVTLTNPDAWAWWQVDLGTVQSVDRVVVWNRTDCCADRLKDYWVLVSNAPFAAGLTPAQQAARSGVWSAHLTSQPAPATTVALPAAGTGRYVMVQQGTQNQALSLAEVQVLGLPDLAQGRTATQSSTGYGAPASRAVDGNTDGVFNNGSVTHTNNDAWAWWQVDLGSVQSVDRVAVWNRTDCCSDRLRDYWVFVSSTPFDTGLSPSQQAAKAGVWSSHLTSQPAPSSSVTLPAASTGRYVMVQQGTQYQVLHLAEVLVFGQLPNLAQGRTATQSSTALGASASRAVDGNIDGSWAGNSVTHTNTDPWSWWQVDLGAVQSIDRVVVWNRTDCCVDRLKDFWVFVSSSPFTTSLTAAQQAARSGVWSAHLTSAPAQATTVTLPATSTGRYVMVQEGVQNQNLHMAEVQVFGQPSRAQGRAAAQSSTGFSAPASRAVDGNVDGVFNNGSVTHTNIDTWSWWLVDLGAVSSVDRLSVWNRTDCCSDRLKDYWVFVSNAPLTAGLTPAQQAARSGVWSAHLTSQPSPSATISLPAGSTGRYVAVQQGSQSQYLSLAEVLVFAR